MRPGVTHLPLPSMTRAPFGTAVVFEGPTRTMRVPSVMTVLSRASALGSPSSGWISVAPTMAMGSAWHGRAASSKSAKRLDKFMLSLHGAVCAEKNGRRNLHTKRLRRPDVNDELEVGW